MLFCRCGCKGNIYVIWIHFFFLIFTHPPPTKCGWLTPECLIFLHLKWCFFLQSKQEYITNEHWLECWVYQSTKLNYMCLRHINGVSGCFKYPPEAEHQGTHVLNGIVGYANLFTHHSCHSQVYDLGESITLIPTNTCHVQLKVT